MGVDFDLDGGTGDCDLSIGLGWDLTYDLEFDGCAWFGNLLHSTSGLGIWDAWALHPQLVRKCG